MLPTDPFVDTPAGGEPLAANIGVAWDVDTFLRVAASLAATVARLHARGIVHRGIAPETVLVDLATGEAWLGGLERASRQARERQAVQAGTLLGRTTWLAPEQTGRFNRSLDHRVDLYALGLVLYRMVTGAMPFAGEGDAAWIKNHVTRAPVPPRARVPNLPSVLNDLVLRLLAKEPEDRYQTAASVEADLRQCLDRLDAHGGIAPFALSTSDAHDGLLVSERVHGRDGELSRLVGALERVADTERPQLVLVDAPAGTGKSVFVGELDRVLVARDGLFVRGKADQHDAGAPLAVIGRALADLGEALRLQPESLLAGWREAAQAIPGIGALSTLASALGPLPPPSAEGRTATLVRRLFRVLGRRRHPLVLFVDDLQWVDAATLDLLEELLASGEGAVLVVGAYRSGEAGAAVERLRKAAHGAPLAITLGPLPAADVGAVVTNTLHRDATSLAAILHERSGGNPFFAIQLLLAFADEHLVSFSAETRSWHWDEAEIRVHTGDIATLVASRIRRLPAVTRTLVEELACLGATASVALLGLRPGIAETEVHARLHDAVEASIVRRDGPMYSFVHDRVQEAAYGLLTENERRTRHLALGRRLVAELGPAPTPRALALALGQMNRVVDAIEDPEERARLAALDVAAGRHAMATMAYAAAHDYLTHAWTLGGEEAWTRDPGATFELGLLLLASTTFGGMSPEPLFAALVGRARDDRERGLVYALRVRLETLDGRLDAALERALAVLAELDIALDDARARTAGPRAVAAIEVIAAALPAAWLDRPEIHERLARTGVALLDTHGDAPRAAEIRAAASSEIVLADDAADPRAIVEERIAAGALIHAGLAAVTGAWQRFEAGDPLPAVRALVNHFATVVAEVRCTAVVELLEVEDRAFGALVSGVAPTASPARTVVARALASLGALVRAVHEERFDDAPDIALPETLRAHPAGLTFAFYRGVASGEPSARASLALYAGTAPRLALVDAEIARRGGDSLAALRAYASAIELARRDGPLPVEALALARLASLQRALGLERGLATTTLEAASAYRRWGMTARADALEQLAARVGAEEIRRVRTVASLDPAEALALAARLDGELEPDAVVRRLVALARDVSGGAAVTLSAPEDPPSSGAIAIPIADEHGILARLDVVGRGDVGRGVLELLAPHAARTLRHAQRQAALARAADGRAASEAMLARFQSILDESQRLSRTGSFAWKPETNHYLHWSAEMNRILGLGPDDPWPTVAETHARIHPDDIAGVQEAVAFAERHGSLLSFTHRFVLADAGFRNVHILTRRVEVDGQIEYRGVAMDITEQQRSRDALEKALVEIRRSQSELQRAQSELAQAARAVTLGELATSIAHEINQPIGAMVADANAGLNWLAAGNDAGTRASLEAIARDGERASEVVKRVRAHMARAATSFGSCDVVAVVRAALAVVRPELVARGALVEAMLADEALVALADPSQLQQLVVNLVTNAAEATGEVEASRRRIVVRLARQGADAVIAVEDMGRGFSGEPDRFLEAFTTTKPDGLGMGLSISRSIVERHGGRLQLQHNAPFGAVVRVTLPILTRAPSEPPAAAHPHGTVS